MKIEATNGGRFKLNDSVESQPFSIDNVGAAADGIVFNLTADSLSLSDGTGVTSRTDQTGNVELTGGSPVYQTGSSLDPTVRADGNDRLAASQPSSLPTGSGSRSVAVVHEYDSASNVGVMTKYGTLGNYRQRFEVGINRDTTESFYVEVGGPGKLVETGSVYTDGEKYVSFFIYPAGGAALDESSVYINGTQATFDTNAASDVPSTTTDTIEIFEMENRRNFTGDVSEIVWYNKALGKSTREYEESRLAEKWNISM